MLLVTASHLTVAGQIIFHGATIHAAHHGCGSTYALESQRNKTMGWIGPVSYQGMDTAYIQHEQLHMNTFSV